MCTGYFTSVTVSDYYFTPTCSYAVWTRNMSDELSVARPAAVNDHPRIVGRQGGLHRWANERCIPFNKLMPQNRARGRPQSGSLLLSRGRLQSAQPN